MSWLDFIAGGLIGFSIGGMVAAWYVVRDLRQVIAEDDLARARRRRAQRRSAP